VKYDGWAWPVLAIIAAAPAVLPGCADAQSDDLVSRLQTLAKTGNAEAIYHLGMAFHTGTGVKEDRTQALAEFRKAAAMGDPLASYKLGCYFSGQGEGLVESDEALALRYKLVAARAGYALAQQDVGTIYAGRGDVVTGLRWLTASADQGWSGGLMALASAYNGAAGVDRNAANTAAYFRLFLDRTDADTEQRVWLERFEQKLSAADKAKAAAIVAAYRAKPTALTLKALSGLRAAQALVALKS
jgi:TPR repeat protein